MTKLGENTVKTNEDILFKATILSDPREKGKLPSHVYIIYGRDQKLPFVSSSDYSTKIITWQVLFFNIFICLTQQVLKQRLDNLLPRQSQLGKIYTERLWK